MVTGGQAHQGTEPDGDRLVLIVEDNEKNLKLARDLLRIRGYRTAEAVDGGGGIEMALQLHPTIVLMDIQLPDMDGWEALHKLRADPRTADIPVVAVTAFAMEGDREKFLRGGFDGYITKPIDVRLFPGQVESYCAAVP
jgi:two-component system cell cycle response regulator DivK